MMFKTHLAIGFFISILMLQFFEIEKQLIFVFFVVLASVIPDIDITTSKVGKKTKPISWILQFLFGHRGIVHSIFMPIFLYMLLTFIGLGKTVAMGVFIGYFIHLFADAMTRQGVMFLAPISIVKISGPIRSNGIFDYLIFIFFIILTISLLF